jgi:general stress protein YciG
MTDQDHSNDESMTTSQAGKLGGDKVNQERGPQFYSEIGKKQGKANNPGNFANRPRSEVQEAGRHGGEARGKNRADYDQAA